MALSAIRQLIIPNEGCQKGKKVFEGRSCDADDNESNNSTLENTKCFLPLSLSLTLLVLDGGEQRQVKTTRDRGLRSGLRVHTSPVA